ncbi:MAG: NPCBM/NEW2 domain-containing protein [Pseudomonadota bacterium]
MILKKIAAACMLACLACAQAHAKDPIEPSGRWTANTKGAAALPPMGWNSWNAFLLEIDEEKVIGSAQKLVDSGLAKLGYKYVNIDDGWWSHRDTKTGQMVIKSSIFPSAKIAGSTDTSFKNFTSRIHGMGLKAGIYTDIGYHSCGQAHGKNNDYLPKGTQAEKRIGLEGNIDKDIKRYFADWGFDFIKVDACGITAFAPDSEQVVKKGYTALGPIISTTPNLTDIKGVRDRYDAVSNALQKYRPDNDYLLSLCIWGAADVRSWGKDVGNISRTSNDIMPFWGRLLHNLDATSRRALYAQPGSWNDPDMLFVGHGDFDQNHLVEARSHFALWAILNAPLIIGYDLRNAPKPLMDIFGNAGLIALNQDPAGHQATLGYDSSDAQIYVKTLGEGQKKGVVLFNRGTAEVTVTLMAQHLKLDPARPVTLRNLWTGETTTFTDSVDYKMKAHEHLAFEAAGTRQLKNGVYLSEIPGLINVATDGVRVPELDPAAHRSIHPWEGTNSGGERHVYTGWGGAQADATPFDQTLQLKGKKFITGLGVLGGSRLEVKNQGFTTFEATVGVDDSTRNIKGRVRFEVYGDGRLLASSKPVKFGDAAQAMSVKVAGVKVVELVVRNAGPASDVPVVASWADAALKKAAL